MAYRLEVATPPETLGAIELTSIARGYAVADAMVKRAPIAVHDARPYSPGKFLIVVSGDIASVEASLEAGVSAAGTAFWDQLLIPNLMPGVVAAINREAQPATGDTVGVVESFSAVAMIRAADAAIKAADIGVESVTLLAGIGGKAFIVLSGELTDVEAAVDAAVTVIPADMLVERQIIPRFSREIIPFLPGRA